jgi:hypothetical protein
MKQDCNAAEELKVVEDKERRKELLDQRKDARQKV